MCARVTNLSTKKWMFPSTNALGCYQGQLTPLLQYFFNEQHNNFTCLPLFKL